MALYKIMSVTFIYLLIDDSNFFLIKNNDCLEDIANEILIEISGRLSSNRPAGPAFFHDKRNLNYMEVNCASMMYQKFREIRFTRWSC